MNEYDILNAMYDGVLLMCRFDSATTQKISSEPLKLYGYKCNIKGIEVGDRVIVLCNNTLKVVTVEVITDSLDMLPSTVYKWAIAKVDMVEYDKLVSADEEAVRQIRKMRQKSLRRQMIEQSGISDTELAKILSIASK